jgi:hypothetical protein
MAGVHEPKNDELPEVVITDAWYCHGVYYVPPSIQPVNGNGDWFGVVFKEAIDPGDPDKPWQFKYRFRWYVGQDTDPFLGENAGGDRKSAYLAAWKPGDGPEKPHGAAIMMGNLMALRNRTKPIMVIVGGGKEKMVEMLHQFGWCHFRDGETHFEWAVKTLAKG